VVDKKMFFDGGGCRGRLVAATAFNGGNDGCSQGVMGKVKNADTTIK
jgi:hypothetical protein